MKQATRTISDRGNVKTSLFEKISYGMGDVACNVVFALTSGLVTYFLHQCYERICRSCRHDYAAFAFL